MGKEEGRRGPRPCEAHPWEARVGPETFSNKDACSAPFNLRFPAQEGPPARMRAGHHTHAPKGGALWTWPSRAGPASRGFPSLRALQPGYPSSSPQPWGSRKSSDVTWEPNQLTVPAAGLGTDAWKRTWGRGPVVIYDPEGESLLTLVNMGRKPLRTTAQPEYRGDRGGSLLRDPRVDRTPWGMAGEGRCATYRGRGSPQMPNRPCRIPATTGLGRDGLGSARWVGGVPVGGTEEPGWFVQLQAVGHSVKRKEHICPWTEAEAGWGWARGKGTQERRAGGAGRHSKGGWVVGMHHDWPKLPGERLTGGGDPEGRGLGRPPGAPRSRSPEPALACLKLGVMVGHDKRGDGAGGPGGGTWPGSRAPPPALCSCLQVSPSLTGPPPTHTCRQRRVGVFITWLLLDQYKERGPT